MLLSFILAWTFTYFAPDSGGGDGVDDEQASRDAGFKKLAERYNNDGTALAKELFGDNYTLRRKNDALKEEVATLKGKVPAEGGISLSAEQAQQWAAYQALGTPDKLKEQTEEATRLQGKVSAMEREQILGRVSRVAKFDPDVLAQADTLASSSGKKLSYEVKQTEVNGEKIETAIVKDGDVETPLEEYAKNNWPKLIPALVVQEENGSGGQSRGSTWPSQHQGSGGGNRPTTPQQQTKETLNRSYESRAQGQAKVP